MASFSDDFNRANSTDLGTGWVEVSGDWSIVSNQLSPGAAGGTIILRAAGAMASNDNYAQFKIAATTTASQGVWCRGNSNISSGYLLRNNGTSWDLFSVVGGSFTVIGTYTAAAAPDDVARVQAVGSTIKAYVNGVERISVTNTAVATGTSVGIRADSAGALRFDDFSAADVSSTALLGTASSTESAQPLTGSKASTLSPAAESDAAQPLTGGKTAVLGTAQEAETAQNLAATKTGNLGTAGASEAAQPLTGSKTASLPPGTEEDTAQDLPGSKTGILGAAVTTETAQPLTGSKTTSLTPVTEQDTAPTLTGVETGTLTPADTTETALPLTGAKTAALAPALESDAAHPLTTSSTTMPSPERTYRIPAERRLLAVAAEHRTLIVRR